MFAKPPRTYTTCWFLGVREPVCFVKAERYLACISFNASDGCPYLNFGRDDIRQYIYITRKHSGRRHLLAPSCAFTFAYKTRAHEEKKRNALPLFIASSTDHNDQNGCEDDGRPAFLLTIHHRAFDNPLHSDICVRDRLCPGEHVGVCRC